MFIERMACGPVTPVIRYEGVFTMQVPGAQANSQLILQFTYPLPYGRFGDLDTEVCQLNEERLNQASMARPVLGGIELFQQVTQGIPLDFRPAFRVAIWHKVKAQLLKEFLGELVIATRAILGPFARTDMQDVPALPLKA